jgi:SRSO17 transposase
MSPDVASRTRFDNYLARLAEAAGHADRREPLRAYLTGLLLPGERKSVEPMAARVDPAHVRARHQSMHHFVSTAPWDDTKLLAVARDWALEQMERHAPVGAWVIDDTGMPKKGMHSVGVARQYCGVLGKQENCQVAVAVSLVNATASVPAGYRLYLPDAWARDRKRLRDAGVPDDIAFKTKWEIALDLIDGLLEDDLPRAPVVADAGYGEVTAFREALTSRGLAYVVGIKGETTFWPPDEGPLPPRPYPGRGRRATRVRRDADHHPVSADTIARSLPRSAWKAVRWREGTKGTMSSSFAAVRVRPAHRDHKRREPREVEWLLIEWPEGSDSPTKLWVSTVSSAIALDDLVRLAKIRWRVERDFQELKDQIGLDHYEGRGWRGFHHHGVLSIAAYAYLAAERARLSPPEALAFLRPARLPKAFKPRGAAPASRAASAHVDRNPARKAGA